MLLLHGRHIAEGLLHPQSGIERRLRCRREIIDRIRGETRSKRVKRYQGIILDKLRQVMRRVLLLLMLE